MKVTMKRMTTTVLALGMMSGSLSAAELRFTIWTGNEAHLKMLNGFTESFKAKHTDVTVRYETIPPGDYTQ
jgi:multiple sugar transport system substrate-binding protein